MTDIDDLQELAAGAWWIARQKIQRRIKKMRNYTIKDKTTRNYIGTVRMTPDQAKKAQADFIVKEV